ncbi:uncharacterized protein [Diadema antillarum]|uniref:uncharacterized protein n=1 Tax=Diadema antillarum TaxID=105358 RepID=UPI003A8A6AF6
MATEEDINKYEHLRDLDLPVVNQHQVSMLIGQDVPQALMPLEVREGASGEVYAVRTMFGWTLNGPLADNGQGNFQATASFIADAGGLEEQVKLFWKLEGMECLDDDNRSLSVNDQKAIETWEREITMDGGHYQLPIPFRTNRPRLPDNRHLAEQRLQSLRRKLSKDDYLLSKYKEGMSDLLKKGYAEEVNDELQDQSQVDGEHWYLPHHPVINPKKPGKVRIVFDCAARYGDVALNDVILQGPDLTNKLAGVLLRFRRDPIALTADIEAMFHQVRVTPNHRNVLRFLWWESGDLAKQPRVYRMCSHLFGGTWSPSVCSFALRQTAEDNQQDYDPITVETVYKNFYVDDCLVTSETETKAIHLAAELRDLLSRGGFRLTKWLSNSPCVLGTIPPEERSKELAGVDLNHDALPVERALGMSWNVEEDCFGYKISPKDKPLTRRGLLSVVSSMYDPMGYASPFIVRGKLVLQELCRKGLTWDEPIPEIDKDKWLKWLDELPAIERFTVNRCIRPHDLAEVNDYELHHFSDASEVAYGTASYLVLKATDGQKHSELLMSKSHLAPIKKTTIPRLELSAATMSVRLDSFLKRELNVPVTRSFFWTDSTIVIQYIRNEEKRFRTFVANRIAAIRNASSPEQWHYVDSKSNPADDLSRGLSADDLRTKERWLHGPEFLLQGKENWPTNPIEREVISDNDAEIKSSKGDASTFSTLSGDENALDEMINHYSSWYGLKRAVCWVVKFIWWLKEMKSLKHEVDEDFKRITLDEMQFAEKKMLQHEQSKFYGEEKDALTETDGCVKKSSPIYKLDPRIEEGLIRVGGRLSRSALPLEAKHPVVLPKASHVSKLILREIHVKAGHSGRNYMLSILHEKYWLPGAGAAIRRMISGCVACRRQRAKVMQQKMADLPKDRLTPDEPPFTRVGMDYFGPIEAKRGRSTVKRYGVIFTCLAVRAVHLEIAASLDTDSCIDAIRRFIARRGNVKEIRSDNGTNLVGAERELRREIEGWNRERLNNELLQENIKWSFNPPGASHFGGTWERQIRTVRKLILALTKQQMLSDEGLSTLLCEVESIINNRPITRVSDDVSDVEALTPNHLLLLNRKPQLPPTVTDKSDVYARKRWRQVQYLADIFWRRWTREYLPQLQEREKWLSSRRNVQVGDLVLVVDGNVPRNLWMLGRVLQTMPDSQGFVRSAAIKTKNSVIIRPISKLCMILEGDV